MGSECLTLSFCMMTLPGILGLMISSADSSLNIIFSLFLQQELDTDMRKCKEEFKEFERQDVKYREDFKHLNQKIKKLEDKVEKVQGRHGFYI